MIKINKKQNNSNENQVKYFAYHIKGHYANKYLTQKTRKLMSILATVVIIRKASIKANNIALKLQ